MNKTKIFIIGGLLAGALFAVGQPAFADFDYGWRGGYHHTSYIEMLNRRLTRNEIELRRDLRNGAGPAEIAFDRRQIARDRRLLSEAYGWCRW
jgi:hypothetical protein